MKKLNIDDGPAKAGGEKKSVQKSSAATEKRSNEDDEDDEDDWEALADKVRGVQNPNTLDQFHRKGQDSKIRFRWALKFVSNVQLANFFSVLMSCMVP